MHHAMCDVCRCFAAVAAQAAVAVMELNLPPSPTQQLQQAVMFRPLWRHQPANRHKVQQTLFQVLMMMIIVVLLYHTLHQRCRQQTVHTWASKHILQGMSVRFMSSQGQRTQYCLAVLLTPRICCTVLSAVSTADTPCRHLHSQSEWLMAARQCSRDDTLKLLAR